VGTQRFKDEATETFTVFPIQNRKIIRGAFEEPKALKMRRDLLRDVESCLSLLQNSTTLSFESKRRTPVWLMPARAAGYGEDRGTAGEALHPIDLFWIADAFSM
jgi:hypothetical protein